MGLMDCVLLEACDPSTHGSPISFDSKRYVSLPFHLGPKLQSALIRRASSRVKLATKSTSVHIDQTPGATKLPSAYRRPPFVVKRRAAQGVMALETQKTMNRTHYGT